MNRLHANLAILRRGSRSSNQAAIAMFKQAEWGAYKWNAQDHPERAASTYNVHQDGSGV